MQCQICRKLSLANLGNLKDNAKSILDIFDKMKHVAGGGTLDGEIVFASMRKEMSDLFSKMDANKAIKYFEELGVGGDELRQILLNCGMSADKIEESFAELGVTTVSSAGGVNKLKLAYAGLATSLNLTTAKLTAFLAVAAGVAIVYTGWKIYNQELEKSIEKAKEAGSAWSESNDSLNSQRDRLDELNDAIKAGNMTEQEAYEAKSELYSIQKSLSDSYGDLANGIDLVNGNLDIEIEKVKNLSAAWAAEYVNENKRGGDAAVKKMEKEQHLLIGSYNTEVSAGRDVLESILDKYSENIEYIQDALDDDVLQVRVVGDATEAKTVLNSIMTDIRAASSELENTALLDSFYLGASDRLDDVNTIIEDVGNLYEQYKEAMLISDPVKYSVGDESKAAIEWINDYATAVQNYNDALASGDQTKIAAAAADFNEMQGKMTELGSGVMSQYSSYIDEVASALDTAKIAANGFNQALSGDGSVFDGKGDRIKSLADQLKVLDLDDVDLKSMLDTPGVQRGETLFRKLIEVALEVGLISSDSSDDVQGLIDVLIEAGYVSGEVSNTVQNAIDSASESYSKFSTIVSNMKSEVDTVNSAISEQGYSGNLSAETYDKLIALSSDYSSCIEYQNGAMQLNTEKANKLLEAKNQLKIAEIELQKAEELIKYRENAEEIKTLEKAYDSLNSADLERIKTLKAENKTIETNLIGYDLQIRALEDLTSAYTKWKNVSESDNSDTMYEDMQKAYQNIKDAQESGMTGTGNVVYQAAVELLVPDGQDVAQYMSTLERYIMDGSNGLSNFVTDMISSGLMEQVDRQARLVVGTTIEQICEEMKITPDMAKAIFNALEMYDGWNFDWTEDDFNIAAHVDTSDIDAEIASLQAKIDALTAGETVELKAGESLESLKQDLAEAEATKQELLNGAGSTVEADNTIGYTINANTEEADAALDTIREKLDDIAAKIEDVAGKSIGELGASATVDALSRVYSKLSQINSYRIANKSFTVTANYTSVKDYGSNESHDTSAYWSNASGTSNAKAGIALLGDEYSPDGSPKPELVITKGVAYVVGSNGPELAHLEAGDQVLTADETKRILSGKINARKSLIPAFAGGSSATSSVANGLSSTLKKAYQNKTNGLLGISSIGDALSHAAKATADAFAAATNPTAIANKTGLTSISGGGNLSSLLSSSSSSSGGGGGGGGSSSSSSSNSSSSNEKSQFEKDYEYHNHLVAMERESYEDYINWLQNAYREAYAQGQIELEDFYKYEEEVFSGQKQLVQDAITDIEHKIKTLEREPGNEKQIINYYNQIIAKIDNEIALARARGLSDDDDYIQELIEQKWDYADEIDDIQEEITENAKDAVDDLVDYRIDMLKQDLNNEKDALSDKLSALKDFYSKQKEMLQDAYDEEKYLEEQSEKRKSVSDIQAEIAQLQFDDSAWADKRRKELEEELKDAEKELNDFEKDHALENATDLLDKMYEQQESQIQTEIDLLDEKLNDPNALYNQALRDIQNNTLALYEEMIEYNNKYGSGNPADIFEMWSEADKSLDAYYKLMGQAYKNILLVDAYRPSGYASGTSHATPGIHELFEKGDEYVYTTSDGKKYRMFSGLGDKVLNSTATDFLYRFANNGESFLNNIVKSLASNSGVNSVSRPAQAVQLSSGDVIINGNATQETVSEIRRAQRDNLDYVLREFRRLNK